MGTSTQVRVLSGDEVREILTPALAHAAATSAFAAMGAGEVEAPEQTIITGGSGPTLLKPARTSEASGVKIVSVRAANRELGIPTVLGTMVLLDETTGAARAILDGTSLTEIRTAAAAGVATEHLARQGSDKVAIVGAGALARTHVRAMTHVLPGAQVTIASRKREDAERLASDLGVSAGDVASAVAGADVVCCVTTSATPVLDGGWLGPTAHVNAMGAFRSDQRELDDRTLARASKVVVDQRSLALREAGDILLAVASGAVPEDIELIELGQIVTGAAPGRTTSDGVTVFKSIGLAVQDVVAAEVVWRAAEEGSAGTLIRL